MGKYTLLEKENILGSNRSIIFKRYGTQAAVTDLAILLGGYVSEDTIVYNRQSKKYMAGPWWTKTEENENKIYMTCKNGKSDIAPNSATQIGIRPSTKYLEIFKDTLIDYKKEKNSIKEVKYGEYPQWIADEESSIRLEALYNLDVLIKTGKTYNIDKEYIEYEHNGLNYIRFYPVKTFDKTLSNGKKIEQKPYWVKVSPVEWITNSAENIMISKHILISGIEYADEIEKNYENSSIRKFLNESFEKDILPSGKRTISQLKTKYVEELAKTKQELKNIKEALNKIENIYSNEEELSEKEEKRKKLVLDIIKQTTK